MACARDNHLPARLYRSVARNQSFKDGIKPRFVLIIQLLLIRGIVTASAPGIEIEFC